MKKSLTLFMIRELASMLKTYQHVKLMRKIVFICMLFACSLSGFAQKEIHGQVVDTNGEAVAFANVTRLGIADSTYISGVVADEKGRFTISPEDTVLLRVSSVGYQDTYVNQCHDGMRITLKPDVRTLEGVEVVSRKPVTRIDGDALVTNVKGTVLENVGTMRDVLGYIPGVVTVGGGVEVFGKGVPLIYINGRPMRSEQELDQVSSMRVKKVEVVTNPGARYDATVHAVIRITTEKDPGEGLALENMLTGKQGDYLTGSDVLNVNYRNGNFDVFGMANASYNRQKGEGESTQDSRTTHHIHQDIGMDAKGHSFPVEGKLGFDFSPTRSQSLGAYYQYGYESVNKRNGYATTSYLDDVLTESALMDQKNKNKSISHLVDGYYTGAFGKWNVDAYVDLLWKNDDERQWSRERETENPQQVTTRDKSDGRMMAGEIHVTTRLGKGTLSFGTEDTYSRRRNDFTNVEGLFSDSKDKVEETNLGFYAELAQNLGKVSFRIGTRYEHVNSDYYQNGVKSREQSYKSDRLFPTAMLSWPIGKVVFQMSYSKKYQRPLYAQLSSSITYVNQYLYESGNPLLRPSYSDNLSLNVKYDWLLLMASWSRKTDNIIESCETYGEDEGITLIKKRNSPDDINQLQLMAVLSPQFSNRFFTQLMGGAVAQFYSIDYLGEKKRMNRPMFIVRWNNMWQPTNTLLASLDLNWRGRGDDSNVSLGSSWQIGCSVTKMLGTHWTLKLQANDLFNTARHTRADIYSGVRRISMDKAVNQRQVMATLTYRLNMTKSKYKGSGTGKNEIERL